VDEPLPVFLPWKSPLPRMTTVDWFSKIFLPEALSNVSTATVTLAAFPYRRKESKEDMNSSPGSTKVPLGRTLSRTSTRRGLLTTVPLVGMGPQILRYCSP
jgi:hypothetical protein